MNSVSLQMFQKKLVLSISLAEHLQFFLKMCFISNDKHVSDNDTYNKDDIGWYQTNFAKEHLIEKFNRTLTISIIRNKETFLLHYILEYLKEL